MTMKTTTLFILFAAAALLATGANAADEKLTNASTGSSKLVLDASKSKVSATSGKLSDSSKIDLPSNKPTLDNAKLSLVGSRATPSSGGASKSGDPRVARALDSAGVKYSVDDDGDFRVGWNTGDSRDHLVFINGKTSEFDDMEIRDVWAIGFKADSIDSNNLQALLELNHTYKLGAWEIASQGGKTIAIFSVKVPADASGDVLRSVSCVVAQVADKVEAEATQEDKL